MTRDALYYMNKVGIDIDSDSYQYDDMQKKEIQSLVKTTGLDFLITERGSTDPDLDDLGTPLRYLMGGNLAHILFECDDNNNVRHSIELMMQNYRDTKQVGLTSEGDYFDGVDKFNVFPIPGITRLPLDLQMSTSFSFKFEPKMVTAESYIMAQENIIKRTITLNEATKDDIAEEKYEIYNAQQTNQILQGLLFSFNQSNLIGEDIEFISKKNNLQPEVLLNGKVTKEQGIRRMTIYNQQEQPIVSQQISNPEDTALDRMHEFFFNTPIISESINRFNSTVENTNIMANLSEPSDIFEEDYNGDYGTKAK